MSSPEEQVSDLIEEPFAFFDMQLEAFKNLMVAAYSAGYLRGFDVANLDETDEPTFNDWWSGVPSE